MTVQQKRLYDSPAVMVAVAYAANKAGDKETFRIVRNELKVRFGIELRIPRQQKKPAGSAA